MRAQARVQFGLGILFLVLGQWTLSLLDTTGKTLVQAGFAVFFISWVRYVGHVVVLSVLLGPSAGRSLWQTQAPRLQAARGVVMAATTALFFSALARLPQAEATSINFCAPLFVMLLAPFVLHEQATVARWIGVVVGFSGMLIVVRPGSSLDGVGVALALVNAFCNAWFQILTRRLSDVDRPLTTLYLSGLWGAGALTLTLPFVWPSTSLSTGQWLLFLSMGVTGSLGHYFIILAFRHAQASALSPFMYFQILSATTLGYFVFHQRPDGFTALGILVICAGGLVVAFNERARSLARGLAGRTLAQDDAPASSAPGERGAPLAPLRDRGA